MPLASDDIVIDVSPAISLRPTLRAAYRLERKYDGFGKLLRLVAGGNLGAIAAVVREGAGESALTRFLDDCGNVPLHIGLPRLTAPCIEFIFALAGGESDSKSVDNPISFEQHHANLFRIATGWLGWTPADAWEATPAEIIEAHKGRTEMLSAIFGGGEKANENSIDLTKLNGEERRAAMRRFASLGSMAG